MKPTILITGGTGYIGSWVSKYLLEQGYTLRLTLRDKTKKNKYQHLLEIAKNSSGTLELWEANLLKEGSFDEAAEGCDSIIHLASPFTLRFKDAQTELINPALLGTQNVLNAASKSSTVKKVVLTSSIAAVFGDNIDMKESKLTEFTEEHFNYSSSIDHNPYSYSKVLAEKEAWKIAKAPSQWKLVVINPVFVLGPSLTIFSDSESLNFMKEMLGGKYHLGAPDLIMGYVDVRDVAKAHILALESPTAEGRHILVERTLNLYDFSQVIKGIYGKKFKLPLFKTPKFVLYLIGWLFGITHQFITRSVGHHVKINNSKSKEKLGIIYTPLNITIKDMVTQMQDNKVI